MIEKQEEKIQEEIIRRALERSDSDQEQKLKLLQTQSTLDSLHEITGLPHAELEKIAEEVKASYVQSKEGFFSIKNQVLIVLMIGGIFFSLLILLFWLF